MSLELKAGVIGIEISREDKGDFMIVMAQKKPEFLSMHDTKTVAKLFGLDESDTVSGAPIQTVSTGTPQLMIPVKSLDVLEKAAMNISEYKAYKAKSDFFSPHLFCLMGMTSNGSTFARHFGVPPDTAEDAFTGSATGGMAAYLWHHGLIRQPKFIAEQGHWMGRPGSASVEVVGDRAAIETVKVGGKAVVVMKGEISV